MYPDMLAEVSALEAIAAEREGAARCDRCSRPGEDFLGQQWLCAKCRAAALAALEREVHHANN